MRLKISYEEALKRIDALIIDTKKNWGFVRDKYWKAYAKLDDSDDNDDRVYIDVLGNYIKKYEKCILPMKQALADIFLDHSPIYEFESYRTASETNYRGIHSAFLHLEALMESKIKFLMDLYHRIEYFTRSPLVYLKDKAELSFYGVSLPLTKDTNEAELCAFMFDFPLGQPVEFSDIYDAIKGIGLERPQKWGEVISHAYDSINKKTRKGFGFPIFKKSGVTLTRSLPSRLVASL